MWPRCWTRFMQQEVLEMRSFAPRKFNGHGWAQPLRILMTADAVGGVWTYALELARALAPHRVHVSLATMGPRPSAEQKLDAAEIPNLKLFESDFRLEWMEDPWCDVARAGEWLLELARVV